MRADLETLERRQRERLEHLRTLESLIETRQREIENVRANSFDRTVHRFALLHGYK